MKNNPTKQKLNRLKKVPELTNYLELASNLLDSFGEEYKDLLCSVNNNMYKAKRIFRDKQWEKKQKAKSTAKQASITAFFAPQ